MVKGSNKTNRSFYCEKNISGSKVVFYMFADTVEDTMEDSRAIVDFTHNNTAFYQGIHVFCFGLRIHIADKLPVLFAGLENLHE